MFWIQWPAYVEGCTFYNSEPQSNLFKSQPKWYSIQYLEYVTRSRGMSHLSKKKFFYFLTPLSQTFKMLHFDANRAHYNWISGYGVMKDLTMLKPKNNIKQKNFNTVFANISKTTSPTSDSFLLIMSHMWPIQKVHLVYFWEN